MGSTAIDKAASVHQLFDETHHTQVVTWKMFSAVWKVPLGWQLFRRSAIRPAVPIACAPILDRIETTRLQVLVEQGPECARSSLTQVRRIVDNDVKSVRCAAAAMERIADGSA